MKRIIVYTCLFGDREPFNSRCLGEPTFAEGSHSKQIIFTDRRELQNNNALVVCQTLGGVAPSIAARRAKMMPHVYLPPHEWSIYIDNRAMLKQDPESIVQVLERAKEDIFFFEHPVRNCIYDEAIVCLKFRKDSSWNIIRQIARYANNGFPRASGLWAGTLIVRRGDAPGVRYLGERWFDEVCRASKRDQIALPFLVHRLGIPIGKIPGTVFDNAIMQWPMFPRDETDEFGKHGLLKRLSIQFARAIRRFAPPSSTANRPNS